MFTNNLIAGASGQQGFYEFPIEQSLKFNDDDSSYLSWTPASAGNRKTWTLSFWHKLNPTGDQIIFASGDIGVRPSVELSLYHTFDSSRLAFLSYNGSGYDYNLRSARSFRDSSAWYHFVVQFDTTQATASDRIKIYVNGEQITDWNINTLPSQNFDGNVSNSVRHVFSNHPYTSGGNYVDGYLAEVNFIDGQALDPTSFGEFKSGVWIPKNPSGLAYGTNGFRLSFQNDTVSEGFNAITYRGAGGSQSVSGLGFSPDFVWIKSRTDGTAGHILQNSVIGATKGLQSNLTAAEFTDGSTLTSFDADGFTVNGNTQTNDAGDNFVAWCWDAGSGSPVSNTDGSITSTVKANPDYGFSIVSYMGNGSNGTIGHGLGVTPDVIIVKNRSNSADWPVYVSGVTSSTEIVRLNSNLQKLTGRAEWNSTLPTSSVFSVGNDSAVNTNSDNYIAYCFSEVTGYSKVGSYSGTGSSGNAITTGFKPAFVMVKRTDSSVDAHWAMFDTTRDTVNPIANRLYANLSNAESTTDTTTDPWVEVSDTGFTPSENVIVNASGGTYVYIAFADTRDNAFWRDQSGNGNDWQPNNLTYQDSLPDSTTNNFAVLNPLDKDSDVVLSEGNLSFNGGSAAANGGVRATFELTGKSYFEYLCTSTSATTGVGIATSSASLTTWAQSGQYFYINVSGNKVVNGTETAYGSVFVSGDIVGVAYDADTGTLEFYKNNVSQGSISTGITGGAFPFVIDGSGLTVTGIANFGQDSSFAGNKPAQGNTDANGYGDFYYAPPSGYLALCTANLPDPVIDPAQDNVPSDYFNTVLWTGDGTSSRPITGLGFQPDMVWTKRRSGADNHHLFDSVRVVSGVPQRLFPNLTNAEDGNFGSLDSFDSDGFTIGANTATNASGQTFVGWSWLAGNGTSSNTDGSITSTVSVNQKAGFSIVSYTGTGANATVGHGLGAAPSMIIGKNRDNAVRNWNVYHVSTGNTGVLQLDRTNAFYANSVYWQNTTPSSTVFTLGTQTEMNGPAEDHIAYCFAEVEGYSKFGSYTGNGSTDGPFVYTGFRPAFVIVKHSSGTSSWAMFDDKRNTYNVVDNNLFANLSDAESTFTVLDMLSNGFKIRTTLAGSNTSGSTYIYMAFAENPFKYANAR